MTPPKIDNAPGLKFRPIKNGWQIKWRARGDLVKRGYLFKSITLWQSTAETREPDEIAKLQISQRCLELQDEMLLWAAGGITEMAPYDGTWRGLIRCYKTDSDSPYRKKEYVTREHYDNLCRRIDNEIGVTRIQDTDTRMLMRMHERIITPKPEDKNRALKISMGHAVIGMMRTITTFGATLLKCQHCRLIRSDLRDMRIENGKPREEALTAGQVVAIRERAHAVGWHSLALAQAFQFDVGSGMRQKDIIGAWVPMSEPDLSALISANDKWIKGIRWDEIDENFVLHHVTSKRKKLLEADLKLSQMVMEEFRHKAGLAPHDKLIRDHLPRTGPLIVSDKTRLPWRADIYRSEWRKLARACGISDSVKNMDSRAGGVTEAFASGAAPDDVRKGATHSNLSMTQRYSRGEAEAVGRVMEIRAASRKKGPE